MPEATSRILVVDNDEGVRAALTARLESQGFEVVTAGTGAQGFAVFNQGGIDVVITDLNMPSGDGPTLARQIRRQSAVPIIVITGFRDEYREPLRRIPDLTIMRKPFDAGQLIDLIEAGLALTSND